VFDHNFYIVNIIFFGGSAGAENLCEKGKVRRDSNGDAELHMSRIE
jgi:hypothetical protein